MITNPIFVVGTGRCGTHWVGQWLRSHPDCYGAAESHFFSCVAPMINRAWNQGLKTWIPEAQIIEAIREFAGQTLGKCQTRRADEWRLVEFSWPHFEHVDFIREVYPDAKFVHIYRDGRNVVESWERTSGRFSAQEIIDRWIRYMQWMLDNPRDYVLNVKYEELMKSPALSRQITAFLEMPHHRDIDSWEYPVNTPNYSYDDNRWQSLPAAVIEQMQPMNELLDRLGYYPLKPRMNRAALLEQLEAVKPHFGNCDWVVGGSACLVLNDRAPDCKDIDAIQLSGEPVVIEGVEFKDNIFSRFYRDLRLDIHYVGEKAEDIFGIAKSKIAPGLRWINDNCSTAIDGFRVLTPEGFEYIHWLLHFHEWEPNVLLEHCYIAREPKGEIEAALRRVMGDTTYDFVRDRVQAASMNAAVRGKHLYV